MALVEGYVHTVRRRRESKKKKEKKKKEEEEGEVSKSKSAIA